MKKTILIIAANPKDTPRLRLDEEIRGIENGLLRSKNRDDFEIKHILAPRTSDFRRAILDINPNIIHFCGHGEGEEGIALEDELGNTKLVSSVALAGLFKLFSDSIECVILNACYSHSQAKAIAEHIEHVIGMKRGIGDKSAIEFAIAFYDALGAGKSIEFSHKVGCNAIQWENITENLIPVYINKNRKNKNSFTNNNMNILFLYEEPRQTGINFTRSKNFINDLESRGHTVKLTCFITDKSKESWPADLKNDIISIDDAFLFKPNALILELPSTGRFHNRNFLNQLKNNGCIIVHCGLELNFYSMNHNDCDQIFNAFGCEIHKGDVEDSTADDLPNIRGVNTGNDLIARTDANFLMKNCAIKDSSIFNNVPYVESYHALVIKKYPKRLISSGQDSWVKAYNSKIHYESNSVYGAYNQTFPPIF